MDTERPMDPALYKAATQGKVASLRQLVDPDDPSVLRSTTPQLNTVLHLAAVHGHAAFAGEVLEMNIGVWILFGTATLSFLLVSNSKSNSGPEEAIESLKK
jgi:hypothetical protein